MPILKTGQITDEKGNLTGQVFDFTTGQIKDSIPQAPTPKLDLGGTYTGLGGTFVSNAIPVSTLTQPQTPLNVTQPVIPPLDIKNIPITEPAKTEKPLGTSLNEQIESLQQKLIGKEAATAKTVGTAAQGYETELVNLNKQIRMHQANALAAQEKALASGETLSFAS